MIRWGNVTISGESQRIFKSPSRNFDFNIWKAIKFSICYTSRMWNNGNKKRFEGSLFFFRFLILHGCQVAQDGCGSFPLSACVIVCCCHLVHVRVKSRMQISRALNGKTSDSERGKKYNLTRRTDARVNSPPAFYMYVCIHKSWSFHAHTLREKPAEFLFPQIKKNTTFTFEGTLSALLNVVT